MKHPIEQLAAWLDPWLSTAQVQRALIRLDERLAAQLPRADGVWQARALHCLGVALPAAALLPAWAPACMAWCREQLPARSQPAIRSAGTVLIRDSSSGPLGAVAPLKATLHNDAPRTPVLRPRPAAVDLQRWLAAEEADAALAAVDIERWPLHPSLATCPSDVCTHLAHLLRQGALPPVGTAWLEWIVHRLELRGRRAGWDRQLQQLRFGIAPALLLVLQAWHTQRDLRFVNTLLRVGDRLLRAPQRLQDVEARAALVATVLVREAALLRLQAAK